MRTLAIAATLVFLIALAGPAQAVDVTVDPGAMTNGYANFYELDGTTYVFESPWGFTDLVFFFTGSTLTLQPNQINDPNEFWYQCVGVAVPPDCGGPGAPGNKVVEANGYAEVLDGSLAGQTLTFTGEVLSNTFTAAHEAFVFIRDFAPGFGSVVETKIPLPASGFFSISQALINDPARPVQWGFQVKGVNVWSTDIGPFGFAEIGPAQPVPVEETTWSGIKALYN